MSDFLTRLVERQGGTVAMVQPRTLSMFAPAVSRSGPADLPVLDSSSPIDEVSPPPAAFIRRGDNGDEVASQTDQQEGRPLRRAESVPARLVSNTLAVVSQPAHEVPPAPRTGPVSIEEQAPRRQTGLRGQKSEGHLASSPILIEARIESPPRLVETRDDTARSFAEAPPSLASGTVKGRRTEQSRLASTEPPVEVTIGRIEVTAVSTAPDTKRKPGSRRPAMSLEEYLTRRHGGRP
jgi:hypothetical protein